MSEELQKSTTDPHGVLPQKLHFDTFFKNPCFLKQSKGRIGLLHLATCMIYLEDVILEEFNNYNKFKRHIINNHGKDVSGLNGMTVDIQNLKMLINGK